MNPIEMILLVFGFVLFLCAAAGLAPRSWQLGWLGLACWILTEILFGATHFHV